MGRKKLKKGEQIVEVRSYVKEKYKKRLMDVVDSEVNKIKLEELVETQYTKK